MEEPRIGLRGLIEHLTCLEDESTCTDIMACPLLAEESLPERRVAALQAWEQEQAAWEVIRQEIESEDRARVREAAKEGIKLVDLGTETKDSIPMVVEDLVPEGQIILLCGEEGTGKSWWIYQLAGEMCAGGLAFG